MKQLHYSDHAFDRVKERLSLTDTDVLKILEKELYVLVGDETGSNRRHCLFYSYPDSCCFVAIQDKKDGTIITVLPVNYHNRWKVSLETEQAAEQLIISGKPKKEADLSGLIANEIKGEAKNYSVFKISVSLENYRVSNLGSVSCEDYNKSDVTKNPEFVAVVLERLAEKNIALNSVEYIRLQVGKQAKTYYYLLLDGLGSYYLKKR